MAAVLVLARLAFLSVNIKSFLHASTWELSIAFLRGFRFDIATVMLSVTALLILLWIPAPYRFRKILSIISFALITALFFSACIVLTGDAFFFVENSHHVTLEPVDMFSDPGSVIKMLLDGYLLVTLVAIALFVGFIWLIWGVFKRALVLDANKTGADWRRLYLFLPIMAITIIGARGGLQKEPLKSADAVADGSAILGNIVLNGWYSFITEAVKTKRPDHFMEESLAVAEVRRLVDSKADYVDAKYPLYRKFTPENAIVDSLERLNVVLIVVESLNAAFLQSFGGKVNVMPFLDSLASQSLIFPNFHAISTRSFRGVTAIIASYPNLSVDSYRMTSLLPKMRGLGTILTENGYKVRFMHAAPDNSMGIAATCRMSGYEDFVSEEDFAGGQSNGSWGIWDHIALQRMSREMDGFPEPFHYGIFTLCTHSPWKLPDGFAPSFDKKKGSDGEILNTFAYLDGALRDFFQAESQQPRFERTLYVIVGDHTTHSSEAERFRVGAIFFAPGKLRPDVDNRLAHQMDIMPTILDACGVETSFSAFGSSLLQPADTTEWSVHYQSNQLTYRQDGFFLVSTIIHTLGLNRYVSPDSTVGGLMQTETRLTDDLTFRLKVVYQISEMMMQQNRIVPDIGRQ